MEAENFEGGQAEVAAGGYGKGLEKVEFFEGLVGVECDEFGPVVAAGCGDGRGDDAEVFAGIVDADEEESVAVVGVVFLIVGAGRYDAEFAGGIGGVEEAVLVGGVAAGF